MRKAKKALQALPGHLTDAPLKYIHKETTVGSDHLDQPTIQETNRVGWNKAAQHFYGGTALPIYGPLAPTENDLRLLDQIRGARILEIGCGSGHSLLYIFSWEHPIFYGCLKSQDGQMFLKRSYSDETPITRPSWVCNASVIQYPRKLSTYLNSLIEAGLIVERVIEGDAHPSRIDPHRDIERARYHYLQITKPEIVERLLTIE